VVSDGIDGMFNPPPELDGLPPEPDGVVPEGLVISGIGGIFTPLPPPD
jgi:hypothetical protein